MLSTNTYLPARINFIEYDTSPMVSLRLLDGKCARRPREDFEIVEYLDKPVPL